MTNQTLTCPYCNASLGMQDDWAAGQRIICPRCGDSFPLRFSDAFTDRPSNPLPSEASITTLAPTTGIPLPSRWSNRVIACMLLGLMFLMAGSSLVFMLMTQAQRRGYDTSRPPRRPGKQRPVLGEESVPPLASVAPDELAGLGYLPSGVNFLFSARIPELLASPLSVQILHDPIKLGESQFRLENLPKWVGFRLEEIDHLVFAASIDKVLPPPFYLVLCTTQPYAEEQLRQRLHGTSVPSPSKKKIYAFRVPQQDIPLNAWFADDHTVVFSLFADRLEALPTRPAAGLRQLPEELQTLLKQRREPVAPVWIAGHSADWAKTSAAIFLGRMKKEDIAKLASLRTFAIWIVPDSSLTIKGVFACNDETAARGLEGYFHSLHGPGDNLKIVLDGPWLTLQFSTKPDFLSRLLKR